MNTEDLKRIETALKQGKRLCVHYLPEDDGEWKAAWEISPGKTTVYFTESGSGKITELNQPLVEVVREWDPRWTKISIEKEP